MYNADNRNQNGCVLSGRVNAQMENRWIFLFFVTENLGIS